MTGFDISETLVPKSDQLDAVDLAASGPQVFTVKAVSKGSSEQPVQVTLAEFPRVWRPSKGMRRVLAAGWGTDASKWVGHRVRLFCDPDVMFGSEAVGGTRISHMSHITDILRVPMLVKRGKSATYTVEPLTGSPTPTFDIDACDSIPELRKRWRGADKDTKAAIEQRVKQLEEAALGGEDADQ